MEECCKHKSQARSESEKKELIVRLNRIGGQVGGIKKMIEEDRYCDDVLMQLAAVDKSIKSLAACVLEEHMRTCVVEKIRANELEVVDEIVELFRRFQ